MSEMQKKKKKKKMGGGGGGVTDSVLERTCPEEHLNLSKSCLVAKKTTVTASPKTLQLELLRKKFSAKYGLNGPIKQI